MPTLLLGILVLLLILWAMNAFARADPRAVVRFAKVSGGTVALAGAATLAATGRVGLAVPLGLAGLTLLGLWPGMSAFGRRARGGQTSRVRSAFLEMELDHDTGAMRGKVLAGPHEGVALDALPVATLAAVLPEIDEESRALLMAYLNRRDARWRENTQTDPSAGRGGFAGSGKMTEQEAYQILGIESGASADEVGRAHRALMKKLHPDQGGSTYLAARVNEAKETLLRRHR
jgi:hypothetical protein